LRTQRGVVASGDQQELMATPESSCTNGCTNLPELEFERLLGALVALVPADRDMLISLLKSIQ